MPPRSSLTSSFSITDANNEVVCPLRNQDGSSCRKRCIGVSLSATTLYALPSPCLASCLVPVATRASLLRTDSRSRRLERERERER